MLESTTKQDQGHAVQLTQGKVLIILGPDETANLDLAMSISKREGTVRVSTSSRILSNHPFALGHTLEDSPDVLVVTGFCGTGNEACYAKGIVASESILVDILAKPQRMVKAPKLILVGSRHTAGALLTSEVRFDVLHTANSVAA